MSTFCRKAIIVAFLLILIFVFATFIVITFFTNDKIIKSTIAKVPTSTTHCRGFETAVNTTVSQESVESEVATFKDTNLSAKSDKKENYSSEVSSRASVIGNTKESNKTNTSTHSLSNTIGYETIGRLQIPKTGVDLPILNSISVGGMEIGACMLYSTGKLNETGNTLLATHNYMNGKLFSNNYKLEIGDIIYVTSLDGKCIKYVIYDKFITDPQELSYIRRNSDSKPGIALSCCTNDEANRIVILAKSEI